MIEFTVLGDPQGKARPRVSTKNGKARAYTPKKTADYEKLIRTSYALEAGERKPYSADVPLCLHLFVECPIPKSTPKKKREQMLSGAIRPTKKPDADNVAKVVMDALNGVAYEDDKQIVFLTVQKRYADQPSVMVVIQELKHEGSNEL